MTTHPIQSQRYDVIVIGARCAGAGTAMLLARRGLQVLAVDRDRYGTDTLSTHALMRGGVLQLHRWGLLTSFNYADDVVKVQIKPQDGVDGLYAPRRTVIDKLLVDAARESGAEIAYRTRLIDIMRSPEGRDFWGRGVFAGGMASRPIIASCPMIRAVSAYTASPDPWS